MKKKIKLILSSTLLVGSLFYIGSRNEKNDKLKDPIIIDETEFEQGKDIIQNQSLNKAILSSLNKSSYTKDDLLEIDYLYVEYDNNLDEINNCVNLTELEIVGSTNEHDYNLDNLNLPNLKKLILFGVEDEFNFLKNCPQIEEIELSCLDNINIDFLKSLPNLQKITINECENVRDFNTDDFPNLKSISLNNISKSMSFLKYLDYSEIKKIDSKGIEVNYNNPKDEVEKYASKVDTIVKSFGDVTNLTDEEKLDKVLIYVLDNLVYDKKVDEEGQKAEELAEQYNTDKIKYALDSDSLAICCNYAELTTVLANRVDLETYSTYNVDHMWNIIKINDQFYYVDPTWLDQKGTEVNEIKQGNHNNLEWYKAKPSDVSILDDSGMHENNEIPYQIEEEINYGNVLKLSK